MLLVRAREPEEIADYLWGAVSRVRKGNMVETGHLPVSVHFPGGFSPRALRWARSSFYGISSSIREILAAG